MNQRTMMLIATFALGACAAPQPVISDLSNDRALIQYNGTDLAALQAEAGRACGIHGKTAEGPLSNVCRNQQGFVCYNREYLFACK